MLNSYFVIERRGKFAISLEPDFQIWGATLDRALRFNTYLEAEDMLSLCGRGAKIVLKSAAPTTKPAPISKLAKLEEPSAIAPSLRDFNQNLETNKDMEKHWDAVPEELRSFDIFSYMDGSEAGDPGALPEGEGFDA